jgi:hypothetical protein
LKKYGDLVEFSKTAKRGRPRKPATVPNENLKYAQVIKNKLGKKFQKIKKE